MNPRSGLCLLDFIAQADAGFALHEQEHHRFRRCVFGKLLPLTKAENDRLNLVVLKDRPTQYAISRRLGFFGEIENMCVGGHGSVAFFSTADPSLPILFWLCPHLGISLIVHLNVNRAGPTADRAILNVSLMDAFREIERNHDLFTARIADVAGLILSIGCSAFGRLVLIQVSQTLPDPRTSHAQSMTDSGSGSASR